MPILPTNRLVKFLALFCCSGVLLCALLFPLNSNAAFTKQINYQGKLTDATGTAVADATYSIVFTFYDALTGGSVVWTETDSVTTTSGLFSLMLGANTSLDGLDFNQPLYLTLNVAGDGEMTPRKTIGAVTASFNAEKFDGFATTSFLRADITNATATITDLNTDYLVVNGNVGIGTSTPNNLLSVYELIDFNNTDFNTKLGYQAGKNIVTGAQYNTFVGYQAGRSSSVSSSNAADYNSAFGYQSLYTNTTGHHNTANGYQSLYNNTTGSANTAIGHESLYTNTTGEGNTAYGGFSLNHNLIGSNNVALGYYAGAFELGSNAFYVDNQNRSSTAGDKAGALLYGTFNATPANQTLTINASTTIAQNLTVQGTGNSYFAGNVGIGTTTPTYALDVVGASNDVARFRNASLGTTCSLTSETGIIVCSSDERLKKNLVTLDDSLATILKLNPVSFNWAKDQDNLYKNFGFSAQQVEQIIPELVATDESGYKSLAMTNMIPFLAGAIQELDQKITLLTATSSTTINQAKSEVELNNISAITSTSGNWRIDTDGNLVVKTIKADKLCLGTTCLTEGELKILLDKANLSPVFTPPIDPSPTVPPPIPPSDAATSSSPIEATTTPPAPEPIPEPPISESPAPESPAVPPEPALPEVTPEI